MDKKERAGRDEFDRERGHRLARAMTNSGCKRTELAHLLDVSERQITRWRQGHPITKKHLDAITNRCEISADYLMSGNAPGAPEFIIVEMSDNPQNARDAESSHDDLTINRVKVHRLHINLLRHLRGLSDNDKTEALDRVINNRWAGAMEPFRAGAPILDGVPLDRYEIAAVMALRAISDVKREISLINHILSTKA